MARVSVINDDTAFLALMHDVLEDAGYEVFLHREGAQAHPRVKEEQPDLIILDIRMEHPDSGWLVLELLRLDPATSDLPVIVCSADTIALQAKEEMLRRQDCQILEKPFDLDMLLAMVNEKIGLPEEQLAGEG